MWTLEKLRRQTLLVTDVNIEKWGSEICIYCLVLETLHNQEITYPLSIHIMDCSLITYQSLIDDDSGLGEADVISFDISSSENAKKNRIEITADLFFLRVEYGNNVEIISELEPDK